jgi:phospholipase C
MPRPDRSNALDHVVVLMFENRSFDNLLGRLYEPGEVASFEGAAGKDLSNPIPDWVADQGPGGSVVPYGVAPDMNTPSPDPGEEHQHVNTQLYGLIDPLTNRGLLAEKMTAPYNAPADVQLQPTMTTFLPRWRRPRRRAARSGRWASASGGQACGYRPSPSRRGYRRRP